MRGDAFGGDEAGEQPKAPTAESDVAKALRTCGFPAVETQALPSSMTDKVLGGIQKRVVKLDDCIDKLTKADQTSLVKKNLVCL